MTTTKTGTYKATRYTDTPEYRQRQQQREDERQRMAATHLLCAVVVALAQTQGTTTFGKYDPKYAKRGRAVTREVIAQAKAALEEMAAVWQERDLP
jgi:beta-galactosidase GanA